MSKTHDLKTWPVYFAALRDGTKTFEYRVDDRGFAVGDTLRLREWNPETKQHTGSVIERDVVYVLRDGAVPEGRCIMALAIPVDTGAATERSAP